LTPDELLELFRTFERSAFRLETRQQYNVPQETERIRAFQEGRPLPDHPVSQTSLRLVADATAAGKRIYRVHIIDRPLTPYMRFELAVYPQNVAAGEAIYIAERAAHPGLAALTEDFWLFDGDTNPTVVWIRYTAEGSVLGWERTEQEGDVERCCQQRDLAMAHAVSLGEFLAN